MQRFDPVMEDQTYTIGELSQQFGVSFRTLRFYEEKELLRPYRYGHLRRFSEQDRIRLEIILRAKRLGFSLAVIWELIQNRTGKVGQGELDANPLGLTEREIGEQIEKLTAERNSVDAAIEELRTAQGRAQPN